MDYRPFAINVNYTKHFNIQYGYNIVFVLIIKHLLVLYLQQLPKNESSIDNVFIIKITLCFRKYSNIFYNDIRYRHNFLKTIIIIVNIICGTEIKCFSAKVAQHLDNLMVLKFCYMIF